MVRINGLLSNEQDLILKVLKYDEEAAKALSSITFKAKYDTAYRLKIKYKFVKPDKECLLGDLFSWSKSEEGHAYWNDVRLKIKEDFHF